MALFSPSEIVTLSAPKGGTPPPEIDLHLATDWLLHSEEPRHADLALACVRCLGPVPDAPALPGDEAP